MTRAIYQLVEIPEEPVRREPYHRHKVNDLGITYASGMGCSKWLNCFECPARECTFAETQMMDLKFLSNPGNGIKP